MRIYLAAPLFTAAERVFNKALADHLRARGHEVWLPQEREPRERTAGAIFAEDKRGLDWADVVIAILDGPDPDSGTSWECGYAFAQGIPIISLRTDMRGADDGGLAPINIMLAESTKLIRAGADEPIAAIADHLHTAVRLMVPA